MRGHHGPHSPDSVIQVVYVLHQTFYGYAATQWRDRIMTALAFVFVRILPSFSDLCRCTCSHPTAQLIVSAKYPIPSEWKTKLAPQKITSAAKKRRSTVDFRVGLFLYFFFFPKSPLWPFPWAVTQRRTSRSRHICAWSSNWSSNFLRSFLFSVIFSSCAFRCSLFHYCPPCCYER